MSVRILIGDVRDRLRELEPDSIDCVVTSPPYWGLRDYGTGAWEGGNPDCQHRSPTMREGRDESRTLLAGSVATNKEQLLLAHNSVCGKCGASKVDRQIGLEPSWQSHVETIADVFDEVRRVLSPQGTLWLNYGDSYATSVNGRSAADTKATGNDDRTFRDKPFSTVGGVLKPKDLCGIPWRVAFALQERGWWLRQDIIWSKPNPMPESVRDRCTKAHEYLFLLAKSEQYYFDQGAIMEGMVAGPPGNNSHRSGDACEAGDPKFRKALGLVEYAKRQRRARGIPPRHAQYPESSDQSGLDSVGRGSGRNRRSVWTVPTRPFSEAHFATFPPALIEPCILAGSPVGGTVLDPFFGAGTTGLVTERLGRNCIGIELNPEYAALAARRIKADFPILADVEAA